MHRIRDRPAGFVPLTWDNRPRETARCEMHHFRTGDVDAITVTSGLVLCKYLAIYGDDPPIWFRVVKEPDVPL